MRTRRKTLRLSQEPTAISTHIWHQARIKPRSDWWDTNALMTAPTLSQEQKNLKETSDQEMYTCYL